MLDDATKGGAGHATIVEASGPCSGADVLLMQKSSSGAYSGFSDKIPNGPTLSPRDSTIEPNRGGASRGVAAEGLRRHNLSAVLERLHRGGQLTRSDLAASTGLNRSTIADLIGELTDLDLIEEGPGPLGSGPGRPSPVVRARPRGAVVLAVELTVDSIAVATMGLGGHVFNRLRVARPRERFSPEETVQDVARLSGPLLDSLPVGHARAGVGVAVAGVTRRSDGFVHLAPNLGWHDVPLAEMLTDELGVVERTLVANDADLGALGEHRRGVPPGVRDMIYVSGEVGIGSGVIHDGKPLLGAAGYAGEAGHMLINPDGRPCRCGSFGCWETEAGEAALLRHAGTPGGVTGLRALDVVAERAAAGDPATLGAIAEVGRWLGLGVGDLINLFNPEFVVLGGLYQRFYPYLEATVAEGVRMRTLDAPAAMASIVASSLGSDAPLIGAAELVLSEVIADPARVERWSVRPAEA
jgi:predicted NBD/HSP70 family sugar kinase